jgi:HNH endonuclease
MSDQPRPELRKRILDRSEPSPNGCRLWLGHKTPKGYGTLSVGGKTMRAHRLAYQLWRGAIPEGKVLDHVACDEPSCVNPWHVLPVTSGANTLRSVVIPAALNARKTHCVNGHEFTQENTHERKSGGRRCRKCAAEATRAYKRRRAEA